MTEIFLSLLYRFAQKNLIFLRYYVVYIFWLLDIREHLDEHTSRGKCLRVESPTSSPHHESIILYCLVGWIHRIDISVDLYLRRIGLSARDLRDEESDFLTSHDMVWVGVVAIEDTLSVSYKRVSLEYVTDSDI